LKLPNKASSGFTLVELIISILIFSSFLGVLMLLFGKSSDSFKITSWKQQKTAQAQIFWTVLKKNIEEATDILTVQTGVDNPQIATSPRPLLVNTNASTCIIGNILAWGNTNVSFDYTSGNFYHGTSTNFFLLKKNKNRLYLEQGGKKLTEVTDVDTVKIKITSVIIDSSTKEEHLQEGEVNSAVAAIIGISITLRPPKGYMSQSLKLVQNHKFRINIKAKSVANPNYP